MSLTLSTPVTIRAATTADIDSLVLLIDMLNISEGNQIQCDRATLTKVFFGDDARVKLYITVAVCDEQAVAFAFYYWGYDLSSESYGFHLADFAVHADYRRKGVGLGLLSFIGKQCMELGGKWISLTSAKTNRAAQWFYQKAGLQKIEVDFYAMGPRAIRQLAEMSTNAAEQPHAPSDHH